MISERTETLKSFDREDIFFRCATPVGDVKGGAKIAGLVVAVHGFGEHSGRYRHVAEFVCSKGFAFASFDLRGHGNSGPKRGDAPNIHALVLDVIYVVNHALRLLGFGRRREEFFFGILGHSFGALLVTHAASILSESAPPVFLSSPCYALRKRLPFWKRAAADVLPSVTPELKLPLDIDGNQISKNPLNNRNYLADPLNLKEVSARFGKLFVDSLDRVEISNSASQILAPITLVYGADDELVDASVTKDISENFMPSLVRSVAIGGAGHEILNELEEFQTKAFEALALWLETGGKAV